MHDDQQLRSILRRMDRPTDPDPEFADALFRQLTATSRTRPSRMPFVLLAAALLVALLAAGTVVGSGIVELPWFSADANPTLPSQSPNPLASEERVESATPAPSNTATPTATPSVTPRVPDIEVGSMVTPVVDGVTLRESPGTGGNRIGTLAQGSLNFVVDGPVDADGYTWYEFSGPGLPPSSGCITPVPTDPLECPTWFGWAAVSDPDDQSAWFAAADVDCPDPTEETEAFLRLQQVVRAACYGDAGLTFEAFFPEYPDGGEGDPCEVSGDVGWLYCRAASYDERVVAGRVWLSPQEGESFIGIHIDPASGVSLPERGTWLRLTGAFNDSASTLCADAVEQDRYAGADPNPDRAVLLCRTQFVLTAVEETAAP